MSILKRFKSDAEIEDFFKKNNRLISSTFDKSIANCIRKKIPISMLNLLLEYEKIIDKKNSNKTNL